MPYYKVSDFSKQSGFSVHYLSDEDVIKGGELLLPIGFIEIGETEAEELRLSNIKVAVETTQVDPLEKLKAFLDANPDVKELL